MLPSVHEDHQDHVLPSLRRVVRRQRFEPLRHGVNLPSVVAAPLVVELDNGEFVGSAGHEAVKRLVLFVRHDPRKLLELDRRQTL